MKKYRKFSLIYTKAVRAVLREMKLSLIKKISRYLVKVCVLVWMFLFFDCFFVGIGNHHSSSVFLIFESW